MSFMQKMIDETQMPITPKHAFKEKSTKLLILLSLRTIYNHTFQCETPCNRIKIYFGFVKSRIFCLYFLFSVCGEALQGYKTEKKILLDCTRYHKDL